MTEEEARSFAVQNGMEYMETSAKEGINVNEVKRRVELSDRYLRS